MHTQVTRKEVSIRLIESTDSFQESTFVSYNAIASKCKKSRKLSSSFPKRVIKRLTWVRMVGSLEPIALHTQKGSGLGPINGHHFKFWVIFEFHGFKS